MGESPVRERLGLNAGIGGDEAREVARIEVDLLRLGREGDDGPILARL